MSTAELDEWEDVLLPAVEAALDEWATRAAELALPSITADAIPPDMNAAQQSESAWVNAFNKYVMPVLAALSAGRVTKLLGKRNVTPKSANAGIESVPYPRHWLAALTPGERDGLVNDFTGLKKLVPKKLFTEETRIVLADEQWRQAIERHFELVSNRVVGMPDSIFRSIGDDLARGVIDGKSPQELRNLVHSTLVESGHDRLVPNRGMLIARTETTAAYNHAAEIAARIEETATGELLDRVWLATGDERTRETHAAAHGQRVGADEAFDVGGHRMAYPGDPTGPVEEVANCRCTLLRVGQDEANPVTGEEQTALAAAANTEEKPMTRRAFDGVLAPIGKPTGDGRIIDAEASVSFREFPLPLMFQRQTSDGHDQSVIVGRIDSAETGEDGITCAGVLFDNADAEEAAALLDEKVIRPSVDMCDMVADYVLLDADGNELTFDDDGNPSGEPASELMVVREAKIMAATLVAKPAFGEAKINLGGPVDADNDKGAEPDALVAAAALLAEPAVDPSVFEGSLSEPTALTVQDGLVYGHLALWGSCHVGMGDRCVTPPATATDYAHFHTSTFTTAEGPIAVGRLTVGCGHAGPRAKAPAAAEHYDNTGTCWAFVRAYEDEHGIAVAGVVNPHADEATVDAGAAAPLSGDWRNIGGNLELVAALSVNTPGFPVPRSFSNEAGANMSLVAAGAVPAGEELDTAFLDDIVDRAVGKAFARIDAKRRRDEYTEIAAKLDDRLKTFRARQVATIRSRRFNKKETA